MRPLRAFQASFDYIEIVPLLDPLQVMSWAATDDSEHPTVRPHLLNVEIPETQAVPSSAQIESLSPTLVDEVARKYIKHKLGGAIF